MYSRQVSAPILKRKTSRFGLGQFIQGNNNNNHNNSSSSNANNNNHCATSVVASSSSPSSQLHPNSNIISSLSPHLIENTSSHSHLLLSSQNLAQQSATQNSNNLLQIPPPISPRPKASFFDSLSSHLLPLTPLPSPAPQTFGSITNIATATGKFRA